MDECKRIIEKRKSVRNFNSREVKIEQIYDILDSARLAPSAKNRQPWKFYILNETEKNRVIELFSQKLRKENDEETGIATIKIMKECNKLVLAFMDYKQIKQEGHRLRPYYFSMGVSIENALLRATELGIGSLWVYDIVAIEDELQEIFAKDLMFISALCFGFEDELLPRAKKKSLEEIIIN